MRSISVHECRFLAISADLDYFYRHFLEAITAELWLKSDIIVGKDLLRGVVSDRVEKVTFMSFSAIS